MEKFEKHIILIKDWEFLDQDKYPFFVKYKSAKESEKEIYNRLVSELGEEKGKSEARKIIDAKRKLKLRSQRYRNSEKYQHLNDNLIIVNSKEDLTNVLVAYTFTLDNEEQKKVCFAEKILFAHEIGTQEEMIFKSLESENRIKELLIDLERKNSNIDELSRKTESLTQENIEYEKALIMLFNLFNLTAQINRKKKDKVWMKILKSILKKEDFEFIDKLLKKLESKLLSKNEINNKSQNILGEGE